VRVGEVYVAADAVVAVDAKSAQNNADSVRTKNKSPFNVLRLVFVFKVYPPV
jgi:hypothetical protein